jgi:hypothetical protein
MKRNYKEEPMRRVLIACQSEDDCRTLAGILAGNGYEVIIDTTKAVPVLVLKENSLYMQIIE